MKKFAPLPFFFLLLLSSIAAWAQDCSKYLFLQQNKTIEITVYNKKGEPIGRQVYTVSNVSNSGGVTAATVNSQMFDKKDRPSTGATSTIKCTGGAFQVDMKLMIPQGPPSDRMSNAQVTGGNGILEYPAGMKAGDMLKDGNLIMTTSNNNGPSSGPPGPPPPPNPFSSGGSTLNISVFDRKVIGQDTVTTSAGSWTCIKINYKSKINFKAGGPFPAPTINIDGTEWYAPGVGIIKTESQHGSTAITSIK
jgi:hypothetical protein